MFKTEYDERETHVMKDFPSLKVREQWTKSYNEAFVNIPPIKILLGY